MQDILLTDSAKVLVGSNTGLVGRVIAAQEPREGDLLEYRVKLFIPPPEGSEPGEAGVWDAGWYRRDEIEKVSIDET